MKKTSSKWVVWLLFGCAFMIAFFHRYAIGVISDLLRADLALTAGEVSLLASLYFYVYGLLQIPLGMVLDAYGPRKVVIIGMGAVALGSAIFGISGTTMMLYTARTLIGFGSATVFISLLKIQAMWFRPTEFATMAGMTSVIGNLGALMATSPLVFTVAWIGWRSTYLLLAVFPLVIAILLFSFVQDKPPQSEHYEAVASTEIKENGSPGMMSGLTEVLTNRSTWVNVIILFMVVGSYMSFSGLWGAPYLTHVFQISLERAASYIFVFIIATIAGSVLIGMIADRTGKRKPIIQLGIIVQIAAWGLLIFVAPHIYRPWLVTLIMIVLGFSSITTMICFTNIKEAIKPAHVGIATGVINVSPFFGTAFLNSLVARMLSNQVTSAAFQRGFSMYFMAGLIALGASVFMVETSPEEQGSVEDN